MKRYDIINRLIKKNNYKKYLEIGTQADNCLSKIKCNYKVGVDPDPVLHEDENSDKFHKMCSDDFFCKNRERFDIIFIDGLHESGQVYRDIKESLEILNKGGTIIIHDCNPKKKEHQTPATYEEGKWVVPIRGTWNGNVWRAWIRLRSIREDLLMYVIDCDHGCGIIQRGSQEVLNKVGYNVIFYEDLVKNRKKWLNLISVYKFKKL